MPQERGGAEHTSEAERVEGSLTPGASNMRAPQVRVF